MRKTLGKPNLQLDTLATVQKTRLTLNHIKTYLIEAGYNDAQCNAVLLATGEALNNICEHAYSDVETGPVSLSLYLNNKLMRIDITDQGHGLPDEKSLPGAHLPEFGETVDELPEGGFGWFIIRSLTFKVRYSRKKNDNRLSLLFKLYNCASI